MQYDLFYTRELHKNISTVFCLELIQYVDHWFRILSHNKVNDDEQTLDGLFSIYISILYFSPSFGPDSDYHQMAVYLGIYMKWQNW